ncbi:MAG: fumarate hydratase [Planctomycetota bacterium]
MKEIQVGQIISAVKRMCIEANCVIGAEVINELQKCLGREESPTGQEIIQQILTNDELAREKMMPVCQDTGTAVIFVELGQDIRISGGNLYEAINEGVRQGYRDGYLRKSIVADPLSRKNTGDNTPAAIHCEIGPGDKLKIEILPKGGGCENMSALKILTPAEGVAGVKKFVIETVRQAGANPCPPIVVGVGVGGTFEGAALLAKKAHLRPLGTKHSDSYYQKLEEELLVEINNLGIGPQGLGGRMTALAVHINPGPCHITALPVAVNLNCHAVRYKKVEW